MIVIGDQCYYTKREPLYITNKRLSSKYEAVFTRRFPDESEFAEGTYTRIGDTNFVVPNTMPDSPAIYEEDMKWILPEGITGYESEIWEEIIKFGNYVVEQREETNYEAVSGEEWEHLATSAINTGIYRIKLKQALAEILSAKGENLDSILLEHNGSIDEAVTAGAISQSDVDEASQSLIDENQLIQEVYASHYGYSLFHPEFISPLIVESQALVGLEGYSEYFDYNIGYDMYGESTYFNLTKTVAKGTKELDDFYANTRLDYPNFKMEYTYGLNEKGKHVKVYPEDAENFFYIGDRTVKDWIMWLWPIGSTAFNRVIAAEYYATDLQMAGGFDRLETLNYRACFAPDRRYVNDEYLIAPHPITGSPCPLEIIRIISSLADYALNNLDLTYYNFGYIRFNHNTNIHLPELCLIHADYVRFAKMLFEEDQFRVAQDSQHILRYTTSNFTVYDDVQDIDGDIPIEIDDYGWWKKNIITEADYRTFEASSFYATFYYQNIRSKEEYIQSKDAIVISCVNSSNFTKIKYTVSPLILNNTGACFLRPGYQDAKFNIQTGAFGFSKPQSKENVQNYRFNKVTLACNPHKHFFRDIKHVQSNNTFYTVHPATFFEAIRVYIGDIYYFSTYMKDGELIGSY